jgi:hypothetical protein
VWTVTCRPAIGVCEVAVGRIGLGRVTAAAGAALVSVARF